MQQITVEQLKEKLDNGDDFLLLDVREPNEYEEYNIDGKLLPLDKVINGDTEDLEEWKDKEIIVHCRSGVRSMNACMALEIQGFSDVKNLMGGVLAWAAKYEDQ